MAYINPFDFRKIFVDYLLGSAELFSFAFIIVISFACAKFRMTNRIFMLLLVITSLIFSFMLGEAIYILIIFLVGFISFKSISRFFV